MKTHVISTAIVSFLARLRSGRAMQHADDPARLQQVRVVAVSRVERRANGTAPVHCTHASLAMARALRGSTRHRTWR